MDHFSIDSRCEQPPLFEVPYLGNQSNGSIQTLLEFFAFAEVKGFSVEGELTLSHASPQHAAAFMQRWMYFGLLGLLLSSQDMELDESVFVRKTAGGNDVITSSQVPLLLDEWTRKERIRDNKDGSRTDRFDTLKRALSYVRYILGSLVDESLDETITKVITSIQALAYSITVAMKTRFPTPFLGFPPSFGPANIFLDTLLQSQWCLHDIIILRENLYVDTHYYCTTMKPLRQSVSHKSCSKYGCSAMDIDETTYRTQHTAIGCTCKFLNVPSERLHALVDQFKIPLVRYTTPATSAADGSLEIVEKKEDEKNVVFSHVWADGLGNTSMNNALPTCQLARLQNIANMVYESEVSAPVPFYIDTLCVPRNTAFRNKAIRKMRDVYRLAGRVVVLDKDIESISRAVGFTAICVGIFFSGWMRRLWTYQEGALNKSLYFKLSDFIMPFDRLKRWGYGIIFSQDEIWKRQPTDWSVAQVVLSYLVKTFEVLDLESVPRSLTLALLCDAFNWRSTSRIEDEIIVISSMIGQDPEAALEVHGSERMKILLRNVHYVPAALAVYSGDRMEEVGYRWAPKSLLGRTKFNYADSLRRWYSSMLQANSMSPSDFSKEVHVGQVLETGTLRLKTSGFAILPQGKDQSLVSSPFWATEFQRMHTDNTTPVVSGFWRSSLQQDAGGMPDPLPQKSFLIVTIEDLEQSLKSISTMTAFIVIPDEATCNLIHKNFYQDELSLGTLNCRFYCRVYMSFIVDLSIVMKRRGWRQELLGEDNSFKAHLMRPIKDIEWLVS